MSSRNWDNLAKKYFFFYRDGFFKLPYLSNSPGVMIESLKKTPASIHKSSEQSISSNNPFCKAILRYHEIEDGLWLVATNIEIRQNIIAKALYDETVDSEYYYLSFSVFEYEFPTGSNLIENTTVLSTCWTFYTPKTLVSTYFYKGSEGRFCNFIFNKKWADNNPFLKTLPVGNGIQQFMEKGVGFMNWLDIVPDSHDKFKEIWKVLEVEKKESNDIEILKAQTLDLISSFFKTVFDEKRLENYVPLNNKDYSIIAKAEKIILHNLTSPFIGIEKIASEVHLSPTKLKSNFKSVFGLSLLQYHKEKNMLLAMQLIKKSEMQIKNIALTIGFESSSKFTSAFKKRFGILPSDIRNI